MDSDTFDQLKHFYNARPFHPFEVVLEDGARLIVDRPEFIGWSEKTHTVFWANPEDTFDRIAMTRVVAVAPAKSHRGGDKKRRRRAG